MADRTFDVIYNVTGQVVETYPPEMNDGAPSAATCTVWLGDMPLNGTSEFSPSVTIDSVSTTVSSASGYSQSNRRKVFLASTSNVTVGRLYRLLNTDGQSEIAIPSRVVSGSYIEVEDDLRFDYAATSTFVGLRMTFTVDSTWVATANKVLPPYWVSYKAVWSYTLDSLPRQHYTYLRLVRQAAHHSITWRDLARRWPEVIDDESRSKRGQQFRYVIDDAWDTFRFDFRSDGYEPAQIRDTELVNRIVLAGALKRLAQTGATPGGRTVADVVKEMTDEYGGLYSKAVSTLKIPIDEGTLGAASQKPYGNHFFIR